MQDITTSYYSTVNCSLDWLWSILKDKIYNPYKYLPNVIPGATVTKINECNFERVMTNEKYYDVHEFITVEPESYKVTFTLAEDDPQYSGSVINQIVFSTEQKDTIALLIKLQWKKKEVVSDVTANTKTEKYLEEAIKQTVLNVKKIAEQQQLESTNKLELNPITEENYKSFTKP